MNYLIASVPYQEGERHEFTDLIWKTLKTIKSETPYPMTEEKLTSESLGNAVELITDTIYQKQ